MYLWLKRWIYGCNHKWVWITKFDTYESSTSTRSYKTTTIHRCSECMKIKKDVFK